MIRGLDIMIATTHDSMSVPQLFMERLIVHMFPNDHVGTTLLLILRLHYSFMANWKAWLGVLYYRVQSCDIMGCDAHVG